MRRTMLALGRVVLILIGLNVISHEQERKMEAADVAPPLSVYRQIQGIDQFFDVAIRSRDLTMHLEAKQRATALVDQLEKTPGIGDLRTNHPLRPCLVAAMSIKLSRVSEWMYVQSRYPSERERLVVRLNAEDARRALRECDASTTPP